MRRAILTQRNLLFGGALVFVSAVCAVAFGVRRSSVEVEFLRVEDPYRFNYTGYYNIYGGYRAIVLELRHAAPGLLAFGPEDKVLVRERNEWSRPNRPFPNWPMRLMHVEGGAGQEFLVFVPPEAEALRLSLEYWRYGPLDRADLWASLRYPRLDRFVLRPLLVRFSKWQRGHQFIVIDVALQALTDGSRRAFVRAHTYPAWR